MTKTEYRYFIKKHESGHGLIVDIESRELGNGGEWLVVNSLHTMAKMASAVKSAVHTIYGIHYKNARELYNFENTEKVGYIGC